MKPSQRISNSIIIYQVFRKILTSGLNIHRLPVICIAHHRSRLISKTKNKGRFGTLQAYCTMKTKIIPRNPKRQPVEMMVNTGISESMQKSASEISQGGYASFGTFVFHLLFYVSTRTGDRDQDISDTCAW